MCTLKEILLLPNVMTLKQTIFSLRMLLMQLPTVKAMTGVNKAITAY